ncbi:MAG: hypothetical protein ACI92Z_003458 [Paracoccaceae bacterium]|jgi:hypothetical protein
MTLTLRKILTSFGLVASLTVLSACEPGTTSASASLYYDSVMWNDYYHGRPPVNAHPPRPPVPPIARPPHVRPPIHRPPSTRPTPRRR